jgi:serine/threonine protein phosphatase PrpC
VTERASPDPYGGDMEVASRTEVGHVRRRNEDALYVAASLGVVAVADGLGGHPAGDLASRTATDSLRDTVSAEPPPGGPANLEWLTETLLRAHRAVLRTAGDDPGLTGMATTAVLAVVDGEGGWLGHVGDSRAYLLPAGEPVQQVTEDHGLGGYITQALGLDRGVTPDVTHLSLGAGDRLLLCTDGLSNMIDDATIGRLLADGDVQSAVDGLVQAALDAGGVDNVTVVVAEV